MSSEKRKQQRVVTGNPEEIKLDQFLEPKRLQRFEQVLEGRSTSLTILLDRVQNYHNISAVMRSADAFGVADVHLIGTNFQFSPTVSQGTERWVRLSHYADWPAAVSALRQSGYQLVVLRPQEQNSSTAAKNVLPITDLPYEEKLALIFGNEGEGVSAGLEAEAEFFAYIPMSGFVESLNISVACALCLYTATIAPTKPARRSQTLTVEEKESLRDYWLKSSVRNSDLILREAARRSKK